MRKLPPTAKRWIDVFALAVCAGAISFLFQPFLAGWGRVIGERLACWSLFGIVVYLGLLLSLIFVPLIRLRGLEFGQFRQILKYPPTSLAAVIASFGFALRDIFPNCLVVSFIPRLHFDAAVWACGIASLFLGAAFAISAQRMFTLREEYQRRKKQSPSSPAQHETITPEQTIREFIEKPERLIDWLRIEEPIVHPDEDRFGMKRIAQSMARRLLASPAQTFGVIGSYGLGKSSVFRMLDYYLHHPDELPVDGESTPGRADKHPKFITAWVDGWGLQNGVSATEYVLEKALDELSQHADCLALGHVPGRYRAVIERSGAPWLSALSSLLGPPDDPGDTLRRFDPLLEAIGAHLVIFLEDLDRNRVDNGVLAQVEAMLDRLKQKVERVSFVLAVSYETRPMLDFTKICTRIEPIETLKTDLVWKLIWAFKKHANAEYDDIPLVAEDEHSIWNPRGEATFGLENTQALLEAKFESRSVFRAIGRLLETPRALKAGLRYTWDAWRWLHGEIDLAELLVVGTLKVGVPDAFNFLLRHIKDLRQLPDKNERHGDRAKEWESYVKRVRGHWETETREMTPADRNDADTLLGFIFKAWCPDGVMPDRKVSPQSISFDEPTDYWSRLMAERVDDLGDQQILRDFLRWKQNPSDRTLPQKLYKNGLYAEKFEHLLSGRVAPNLNLSGDEVRQLASLVFQQNLAAAGKHACQETDCAFVPLWRMALKRPLQGHSEWVWSEIEKAARVSLHLAANIEYFWTHRDLDASSHAGKLQATVREKMVRWVKDHFPNESPSEFCGIVDPSFPFLLHHFVRHTYDNCVFSPHDWQWFAPIVLAATETDPETMVPQLAILVSKSRERVEPDEQTRRLKHVTISEVDEEFVAQMFGDREQQIRLMRLLSADRDYPQLTQDDSERVKKIAEQARRWLERQSEAEGS